MCVRVLCYSSCQSLMQMLGPNRFSEKKGNLIINHLLLKGDILGFMFVSMVICFFGFSSSFVCGDGWMGGGLEYLHNQFCCLCI